MLLEAAGLLLAADPDALLFVAGDADLLLAAGPLVARVRVAEAAGLLFEAVDDDLLLASDELADFLADDDFRPPPILSRAP